MRLFRKASSKSYTDDPDFGRIAEDAAGSWKGDTFELWGYPSISNHDTYRPRRTNRRTALVRSLASYRYRYSSKNRRRDCERGQNIQNLPENGSTSTN